MRAVHGPPPYPECRIPKTCEIWEIIMIRFSSNRFVPRFDHTFPEHSLRTPRVTRRVAPVFSRSSPRSGEPRQPAPDVRR